MAFAGSLQLLCCQSQGTFSLSSQRSVAYANPESPQPPKPDPQTPSQLRITVLRTTRDESDGPGKRLIHAISYTPLRCYYCSQILSASSRVTAAKLLSSADGVLSAHSLLHSPSTPFSTGRLQPGMSSMQTKHTCSGF